MCVCINIYKLSVGIIWNWYFIRLKKNQITGVPWWCHGLRIQCCHCPGSGCSSGTDSNPGPGTSACHKHGQKKKKKSQISILNGSN